MDCLCQFFYWGIHFIGRRLLIATVLFLTAFLFHVQAIFAISTYIFVCSINKVVQLKNNKVNFALLLVFILSGLSFNVMLSLPGVQKLIYYTQNKSVSSGINSLSLFSMVVFSLIYFRNLRQWRPNLIKQNITMFSTLPFLSFYVFATNISVLGDRLWQWGLIILTFGFLASEHMSRPATLKMKNTKLVLAALYLVALINIIYRYPLTNVFYFLFGYNDFSR